MALFHTLPPGPAYGRETITVSNTAIGITASLVNPGEATKDAKGPASAAFITVETNPIRFTLDGTAPTSSVGHPLAAGDAVVIFGLQSVSALRMIRTGSDASVQVTVFDY